MNMCMVVKMQKKLCRYRVQIQPQKLKHNKNKYVFSFIINFVDCLYHRYLNQKLPLRNQNFRCQFLQLFHFQNTLQPLHPNLNQLQLLKHLFFFQLLMFSRKTTKKDQLISILDFHLILIYKLFFTLHHFFCYYCSHLHPVL